MAPATKGSRSAQSVIRIDTAFNPYRDHVQGKSNEPITVAGLLDRAYQLHGAKTDCTLEAIVDRLDDNAPRRRAQYVEARMRLTQPLPHG